ncbi:hypothetical protein TNCV_4946431 [Trichonephila clavipes]|nr:hypothetical protein TNCV_4946431 [Trichonephila clavipes]
MSCVGPSGGCDACGRRFVCRSKFVLDGASKVAKHPPQCDLLRLIPRPVTVRLRQPKILPLPPQDYRHQLKLRKCQRGLQSLAGVY